MMTIKEFAKLCNCGTQTLRYYDKIDLLKPIKVDPWSGYRYYEQEQALDFIKIKNLQAADFTIDEIKSLLTQSDQQVYDAFTQKIAAQQEKLERIIQIQRSYLKEKNSMEKLIQSLTDFVLRQLKDFEGLREFGLSPEDGENIVGHIRAYMEKSMLRCHDADKDVSLIVNDTVVRGAEQVAERIHALTEENLSDTILFGDENLSESDTFDEKQYDTLWEIHGWDYVRDFLEHIPKMEDGKDYCFCFRLNSEKYRDDISFPMFMLGAMILRKGEVEVCMGCSVSKSEDGQNHFALMKKKE